MRASWRASGVGDGDGDGQVVPYLAPFVNRRLAVRHGNGAKAGA